MKTIERNCDLCGKIYSAKIWYLNKGKNIYCSRNCAQKSHSRPTLEERFWNNVDKKGADDCWEYLGSKNSDGYGNIRAFNKSDRAHRVSYILNIGPIPDGKVVMHTCDNPPCVNPNHFKLGTQQQNIDDMVRKGRNKNGGKGSENSLSVLTSSQRRTIKRRFTGIKGQKSALAREYGVCPQTICNVLSQDYN